MGHIQHDILAFRRASAHLLAISVCSVLTASHAAAAPPACTPDKDARKACRLACEGGNAAACMDLARAYEQGTAKGPNTTKADTYFRRACDGGVMDGCAAAARLVATGKAQGFYPDAYELASRACKGGSGEGCERKGLMQHAGRGTEKDEDAALASFKKGCGLGSSRACSLAGSMLWEEEGGEAEGRALVQKSCASPEGCGDVMARNAGQFYLDFCKDTRMPQACRKAGDLLKRNSYVEASRAYKKGCKAGDMEACALLGALDRVGGFGLEADTVIALESLKPACDAKVPLGCRELGLLYLSHDEDVPQDVARATALLRSACDAGDAPACDHLGWGAWEGKVLKKDRTAALQDMERACGAGLKSGCDHLRWARMTLKKEKDTDALEGTFDPDERDDEPDLKPARRRE